MKLILVRHGESTANVAGILSSMSSDDVRLTDRGRLQVEHAASKICNSRIDVVYVSPLLRTIETSDILLQHISEKPIIKIDARVGEINYGKYSGKPNNAELDAVRESQVGGDYLLRFGETGENKLEILNRLYDFLIEVIQQNSSSSRIVVVSHGSITGWLERIIIALGESQSVHRHVGNAEIRRYELRKRDIQKLLRYKIVDAYCSRSKDRSLVVVYRSELIKLANLYNDSEIGEYAFSQILTGLFETDIKSFQKQINPEKIAPDEVIVVCVLHNATALIDKFIDHYKKLGINNFVFIDNNSDDDSLQMIKRNSTDVSIDMWITKDKFDGYKAMGWKQRMYKYYGLNRWYLSLDIDELVFFVGCEKSNINKIIEYAKNNKLRCVGGVLVDMYTNGPIDDNMMSKSEDALQNYRFFDLETYFFENNDKYGQRIYGGPRTRLFGRHPSLQKFPLIYVDQQTIAINPHFWYPYTINHESKRLIALLHYKFLPGDINKYMAYVNSGVYWDSSSQYRSYLEYISAYPKASFYNKLYSAEYIDSRSLMNLTYSDGNKLIDTF